MTLSSIISRQLPPEPWAHGGKIPWNEPAFSQRMLENHLSQEHDWASRRFEVIDQQVQWISEQLGSKPARILDLGCGPGFYTHQLAKLGHTCVGVDFSPAAIAYARQKADEEGLSIAYVLSDIRSMDVPGQFDLVMLTFGEFNVFQQSDMEQLLKNLQPQLACGGALLLEGHTFEEVKRQGQEPPSWQSYETGLFKAEPHICLQEHFWDENMATATTRFFIIEASSGKVHVFQNSMKAYTQAQYQGLMVQAGLPHIQTLDASQWRTGENFNGKLQAYWCRALK